MTQANWQVFTPDADPHDGIERLLTEKLCPPWRDFQARYYLAGPPALLDAPRETDPRGETFQVSNEMVEMVNAALYLRRPLLVMGKPGAGKSSLIYAVARQLGLGKVLRWPVNSRSTLKDAIYSYDAIARLQDAQIESEKARSREIGRYLRLGPLGTALLPYRRPRALLIDEIDKSDVDLPNDLLNIFEEGEYEIPELARLRETQLETPIRPHDSQTAVPIAEGRLRCLHFPFIVLTSNRERDFSAPFLRRCLRLEIEQTDDEVRAIVERHLGAAQSALAGEVIAGFNRDKHEQDLAVDQLLNAVFLDARGAAPDGRDERLAMLKKLLRPLNE